MNMLRTSSALGLSCVLAMVATAQTDTTHQSRFLNLEVPGSLSTTASGINDAGLVTGFYVDAEVNTRGFVRDREGRFLDFAPPGTVGYVFPVGIDADGNVAGRYWTGSIYRGFVRSIDGQFRTFEPPAVSGKGVFPAAISAGVVAGLFDDALGFSQAFLFTAQGELITFSPWSSLVAGATGINASGIVIGYASQDDRTFLNFERTPDGNVSLIGGDEDLLAINGTGFITGDTHSSRGFVIDPQGAFIYFDAGNATFPVSIADSGAITGNTGDTHGVNHGFVCHPDGTIVVFDAPGAGSSYAQGTRPVGINSSGVIAGNYVDAQQVSHAFLRLP